MIKQPLKLLVCVTGILCSGSAFSSTLADQTEVITNTIHMTDGKPGAPVSLTYSIPAKLDVSQGIGVTLTFDSSLSQGTLMVSLNADAGLRLLSGNAQSFNLDGQSMSTTVSLLPEKNGLYYLNINVLHSASDGTRGQSRSFAVPLQVGPDTPENKVNGTLVDDGEEKIIEMIAN